MVVLTIKAIPPCKKVCRRNESRRWKPESSSDIMKQTYRDQGRKQNASDAEHHGARVRPLGNEAVHLKGDVTIVDPFNILVGNPVHGMDSLREKLRDLQHKGYWEFLVIYKGQLAYIISSESWDEDAAFEVSRNGRSLCVDKLPSRFIAVLTKQMVDLVLEEIGPNVRLEGGVSIQDVDGQLIHSGDGDFVISGSGVASPVRKVSRWIEDECVRNADILCAAGGRWTFCDDTSDEDEDEDDEELRGSDSE